MWGSVKDPVCGVRVRKTTPYWFRQNNKTYYFDSSACRQTFIERFSGDDTKKGFLQRLSEESDGKRKTCH